MELAILKHLTSKLELHNNQLAFSYNANIMVPAGASNHPVVVSLKANGDASDCFECLLPPTLEFCMWDLWIESTSASIHQLHQFKTLGEVMGHIQGMHHEFDNNNIVSVSLVCWWRVYHANCLTLVAVRCVYWENAFYDLSEHYQPLNVHLIGK